MTILLSIWSCSYCRSPNKQAGQISGRKNQGEGDPGADQAGEHSQAFIDHECYQEKIHEDNKGYEYPRSLQRCGVVELAKVDQR